MPIYILTAGSDAVRASAVVQRIRRAMPDVTPIADIQELLGEVVRGSKESVYLLIVAPSEHHGHVTKLLESASSCRGRLFSVLISNEISASDYKALVRHGDADWVSVSANPQEIVDIIARHRRLGGAAPGVDPAGAHSVAISFVPSAGGVGNTTLALETAIRLKTDQVTRDRSICLADLDFQGSHVCDHLDIEPRLKIQEILDNPERLDAQLFEIFISRHASGLHVFAAPRSKLDFCEVNLSALDAFLSLASRRYDLILIDLPPSWFAWTNQVVAASDGVVVTGANSIPGLRQIAETLTAVRAGGVQPLSQIAVAINRCRRRFLGGILHRHHVQAVLGDEKIFYVGEEPMLLESINTGTPMGLMKAGGTFAKEIAAIAGFCAALKSARVTG